MKTTPNWKSNIGLDMKCGSCKHYKPFIKKCVLTARGTCQLKKVYKMRTETCLKYEEEK